MGEKKRILFIAYYFFPNQLVGANRINYWVKQLNCQSNLLIDVITATPFQESEKLVQNQYFVNDNGKAGLLKKIIKDKGLSWKNDLKLFFNSDNYPFKPHIVIFSGSPFFHFSFAMDLKKRFDCIIVLDYRDPFANNPRFKENWFKILLKKWFEKKFNKLANVICSVNEDCLLLLGKTIDNAHKYLIVENGFDESVFCQNKLINIPRNTQITYPGKFYRNVHPIHFLNAFSKFQRKQISWKFLFIGNDNENLLGPYTSKNVCHLPYMDYTEVVKKLKLSVAGIIFTGGDKFESTTKVFDYIAANLIILIITEGDIKTGNLNDILRSYPNVIWSKNNEIDILKALDELAGFKVQKFDFAMNFSRKQGLKKLMAKLNLHYD